jgi:tetratricopeptide (TPR) repeat protein
VPEKFCFGWGAAVCGSRRTLRCVAVLLVLAAGLRSEPRDTAVSSNVQEVILTIQSEIAADDLDGASRTLVSALEQHPRDGGLLNLRGVLFARRNAMREARKSFAEAVRWSPRLTPAWQNLARACQMLAATDDSEATCAVSSWNRVLVLKPDDEEAHASLALLYENNGHFAESLNHLQWLPPKQISETANLTLECADLAALGRTQEAANTAGQLIRREDFSEDDFKAAHEAFGVPASASTVLLLLEALDARHGAGAESLRYLAIAYEQTHRPADARKTLERVAQLDPTNPAHLLELARLADEGKDYEGSLGYLAHARDLDPSNARIHFLFAMIAAKLNLLTEAKLSLDRALAIDPENPDYNYSMGSVILATRNATGASAYFERVLKLRPSSPAAHFALGVAYFNAGDYDKSRTEMLALRNGPKASGAEYFLGRMANIDGAEDEALRCLKRSIQLEPSFAESHTELARVYLRKGDFKEAEPELDRAIQLDPQSFRANSELFVLYKRTHDSRADRQRKLVKQLDEERSRRAELMLRSIEFRP